MLACVSIRMLCVTYYVFITESVYMLVRVIAVIPCSTSSAGLRLVVQLIKSTENDNQYLFLGVETERLPLSTQAFRRISYTPVSKPCGIYSAGKVDLPLNIQPGTSKTGARRLAGVGDRP